MSTEKATIVVVDDTPTDLQLLQGLISGCGYGIRAFPNGEMALSAAKRHPPNLFLLDVNMPVLNGFELCQRIKAEPTLREIPVIFISGRDETMDKVRGFELGGVDYVTKPYQLAEVESRVRAHVELQLERQALEQANARLRELESLRDNLVQMIIHDMRSPLTAILGYLGLVADRPLPEDVQQDIGAAESAAISLIEMVNSLLDVSRLEAGAMPLSMGDHSLAPFLEASLECVRPQLGQRSLTVEVADAPLIRCDSDLIARVVQNLVGNAIKFTNPESGRIFVTAADSGDGITVRVEDNGPGIPADAKTRIFDKFFQVEEVASHDGHSTGLGLTFCRLAIEAHGGEIGVDPDYDTGAAFWFSLPRSGKSGN